jgi:hypothetical protein
VIALRLARAGYWGGDPCAVKAAPVGEVLTALEYETFCGDYEAADYEMQRTLAGGG